MNFLKLNDDNTSSHVNHPKPLVDLPKDNRLSSSNILTSQEVMTESLRPLNSYQFSPKIHDKADQAKFDHCVDDLIQMTGSKFFPAMVSRVAETFFSFMVTKVNERGGWIAQTIAQIGGLSEKAPLVQNIFIIGAYNLVKTAKAVGVDCKSPVAIAQFLFQKIGEALKETEGHSQNDEADKLEIAADVILKILFPKGADDLPDSVFGGKILIYGKIKKQIAEGLRKYKDLKIAGSKYDHKIRNQDPKTVDESSAWTEALFNQVHEKATSPINLKFNTDKAFRWMGVEAMAGEESGSKVWFLTEIKLMADTIKNNQLLKDLISPFILHLHMHKNKNGSDKNQSMQAYLLENVVSEIETFLKKNCNELNEAAVKLSKFSPDDKNYKQEKEKHSEQFKSLAIGLLKAVGFDQTDWPVPVLFRDTVSENMSKSLSKFFSTHYQVLAMPHQESTGTIKHQQGLSLVSLEQRKLFGDQIILACEKDCDLAVEIIMQKIKNQLGLSAGKQLDLPYLSFIIKSVILQLLLNAAAPHVENDKVSHEQLLKDLTAQIGGIVQAWARQTYAPLNYVEKGKNIGMEGELRIQLFESFKDLSHELSQLVLPQGGQTSDLNFVFVPFAGLLKSNWSAIWNKNVPLAMTNAFVNRAVPSMQEHNTQLADRKKNFANSTESKNALAIAKALSQKLPLLVRGKQEKIGTIAFDVLLKVAKQKNGSLSRLIQKNRETLEPYLGEIFVTIFKDPTVLKFTQPEIEKHIVSFVEPLLVNLKKVHKNEVMSSELILGVLSQAKEHVQAITTTTLTSKKVELEGLKAIHAKVVQMSHFKKAEEQALKQLKGKWFRDQRAIRVCEARIAAATHQLEIAKKKERIEHRKLIEHTVDRALALVNIMGPDDLPIPSKKRVILYPILKEKMVNKLIQAIDRATDPKFAQIMIEKQLAPKEVKFQKETSNELDKDTLFPTESPVSRALDSLLLEVGEFLPAIWTKMILQNESVRGEASLKIAAKLHEELSGFDLQEFIGNQVKAIQTGVQPERVKAQEKHLSQKELKEKMVVAAREKILGAIAKKFNEFWRVTIETECHELEEDDQEALIKSGETVSTSVFAVTLAFIGNLLKPIISKIIDYVVSKEIDQLVESYDAEVHENLVYGVIDQVFSTIDKQLQAVQETNRETTRTPPNSPRVIGENLTT